MVHETDEYSAEIADGKNLKSVLCKYCSSMILEPSIGHYVKLEVNLPLVSQNVKQEGIAKEAVKSFWEVSNMFAFHNVGFSNTVGDTKYLTCADCDAGPVGYHDLTTKKSYVALCRVEHK